MNVCPALWFWSIIQSTKAIVAFLLPNRVIAILYETIAISTQLASNDLDISSIVCIGLSLLSLPPVMVVVSFTLFSISQYIKANGCVNA